MRLILHLFGLFARGTALMLCFVGAVAGLACLGGVFSDRLDAFGYYFTETEVKSGNLKLTSLNIGQASDFADWEAGKRMTTYAPIFLAFDDVTSPTAVNELGQTYHTVSIRVMPTAYRVDGQAVSFHGADRNLGQVTFAGVFDLEALKTVKTTGPGETQPVLKGDLQVGDQQFRNISFMVFGGD